MELGRGTIFLGTIEGASFDSVLASVGGSGLVDWIYSDLKNPEDGEWSVSV